MHILQKITKNKRGFTMVELLVVATIIIVLATLGVVSYRQASMSSRNAKRRADLETVRQALVMYRSEYGGYPQRSESTAAARYIAVVTQLQTAGYLSDGIEKLQDPVSSTQYQYSASGNCSGGLCPNFLLTAFLEPNNTNHDVTNP